MTPKINKHSKLMLLLLIILIARIVSITETYEFHPEKPLKVINPFGWDVSAKCALKSADTSDVLAGKLIHGKGKINGRDVGSGMEMEIKNGDSFILDASPEAVVEITNKGQSVVIAECLIGNFANELAILPETDINH